MSKLNRANNLAFNIKPLGLIDGPIEAFEQSYWLIFIVEEVVFQIRPSIGPKDFILEGPICHNLGVIVGPLCAEMGQLRIGPGP